MTFQENTTYLENTTHLEQKKYIFLYKGLKL